MISEQFPFYKDKMDNSYMLFGKQNNKDHANMFTQFRTQLKHQFRSIINHFANKLQLNQDAQQKIQQNLSSFYIWRNPKQEIEVYYIEESLSSEIKYQSQISADTYKSLYEILLSLSNLNIQDIQQEITTTNFNQIIDELYRNVAQAIQIEQKLGNKDQQFTTLKILTRSSLILRPSGDIIKLPKINQNIYNFYHTSVYITTRIPFCNPVQGDFDHMVYKYIGPLNQQTYLPYGQGQLECEEAYDFKCQFVDGLATGKGILNLKLQKQIFEGHFQNGLKHGHSTTINPNETITTGYYQNNKRQGLFVIKNKNGSKLHEIYYKNDQQILKKSDYKFEENMISTRHLINHRDVSINNHCFYGLAEKKWVNQLIVDFYLNLLIDYYKNTTQTKIYLFNTVQSQDIFSSQISKLNPKDINLPEQYKQIIQKCQKYKKIIFILNVDQYHYLVVVYQNQSLFMLNSFASQNDQDILSKIASLFQQQLNLKCLQVEQQNNTYDCSLYSIYNVMLQYKYYNVDVDKIDYRVSFKYIKRLRQHLKNIIINDYVHLILHQK